MKKLNRINKEEKKLRIRKMKNNKSEDVLFYSYIDDPEFRYLGRNNDYEKRKFSRHMNDLNSDEFDTF